MDGLSGRLYVKNDCRFNQSWIDPNVYYRDMPEGRVIFGVYVDDLIIVAPNKATAAALEAVLAKLRAGVVTPALVSGGVSETE